MRARPPLAPVWLLALAVAGCLIYSAGLSIGYYADDFLFYYTDARALNPLEFFYRSSPNHNWYRPLQDAFNASVQAAFGLNATPIHLVQVGLHIALCAAIFLACRWLRLPPSAALIASGYMLVSQANVHAVLSNDTLSQMLGALFGWLSVWCLALALPELRPGGGALRPAMLGLSAALLLLALASKETALGFGLVIGLLALVAAARSGAADSPLARARRLALRLAPFALVAGLYLAVRLISAAVLPDAGREDLYGFQLGPSILVNLAQLAFVSALPVSSPAIFAALEAGDYLALGAFGALTALLALPAAAGLLRAPQRRLALLLAVCTLLTAFPVVLLRRVSELYVYNLTPGVAILLGIGLAALLERPPGGQAGRGALLAAIVALALVNIAGVQHKAGLMHDNAERSAALRQEVAPHLAAVPAEGQLLLVTPDDPPGPQYSVFLMDGFELIGLPGLERMREAAGRRDIRVALVRPERLAQLAARRPSLALQLDPDTARVTVLALGAAPAAPPQP